MRGPLTWGLYREIDILAPLGMSVLIHGETGAGKDVVALALHARSGRADRPLVALSCTALPERLFAPELPAGGPLASVAGATLLFDEVGELTPAGQAGLLRLLQEDEDRRAAEDPPPAAEGRVLATTHRDLQAEVAAGRFRADLYHRLAAYVLRVPPLRERREDIPDLVGELAAAFAPQIGAEAVTLASAALDRLQRYDWPGNVRELRNTIERGLVRARARQPEDAPLVLEAGDLDLGDGFVPQDPAGQIEPLYQTLERARRQALVEALARTGGNVREAGRLLGISRSLAYREAGRMGLLAGRPRSGPASAADRGC